MDHLSAPRAQVLVADDDVGTLAGFACILREAGHAVSTAITLTECVSLLRHGSFDLLLLDVRFPRANGLNLLRRLRRIGFTTPTVIVTGFAEVQDIVTAMTHGAIDVVQKPLIGDAVTEVVERALAKGVRRERQRMDDNVAPHHVIHQALGTMVHASRQAVHLQLACLCAEQNLSAEAFVTAARALRSFLRAGDDAPVAHAISEARYALLSSAEWSAQTSNETVLRVLNGLRSRTTESLGCSASEWAKNVGVHRSHLGRLIYEHTGLRFRDWRRVYRLHRAACLLRSLEQAAQVAYQAGYRDASQFAREFRQETGMSPRAFGLLIGSASRNPAEHRLNQRDELVARNKHHSN